MNMMDWGDIGEFVSFGEVGRDQIDDAAYYILIAPQNVVGSTILTNLGDMVCSLNFFSTSVRLLSMGSGHSPLGLLSSVGLSAHQVLVHVLV